MNEKIYNEKEMLFLSDKNHKKEKRFLKKGLYLLNNDYQYVKESFQIMENNNTIFIVNGGLTTGADSISILELFAPLEIDVNEIILVSGKQYSFVIVNKSSEAKKAVNILSGVVSLPGSNNPLYMCCINKVPSVSCNVKYECPPGLFIAENFISVEEEIILADLINWNCKPESRGEGSMLKQREVRHFGYEFDYSSNLVKKVSSNCSFPQELNHLCERIVKNNFMKEMPDQITVNRYLPGQGIPPHVDTHSAFTDEILSLSILGDVTMEFKNDHSTEAENDTNKMKGKQLLVYLPARSLCIMTDQSRYLYTHGIASRKTDIIPAHSDSVNKKLILKQRTERVSFTFRKVRQGSCHCLYPIKCDSQNYGKYNEDAKEESLKDKQNYAENPSDFENSHVLKVYEEIADHFDQTRHKPWPKVLQFVESLPMASILLDVGCGNGKYMSHKNKPRFSLGIDNCQNLLSICREKLFEVSRANCLLLPFRNDLFDAVISIALIHHLSSPERRRQALEEMIRILRIGGLGLVYVWALEQRRGKTVSAYLKQNKSNRLNNKNSDSLKTGADKIFGPNNADSHFFDSSTICNKFEQLHVHENRTDFAQQDLFVPWKKRGKNRQIAQEEEEEKIFNRYYHVFKEGELEDLLSSSKSVKILSSYYDEGNWCVSFQKTSST